MKTTSVTLSLQPSSGLSPSPGGPSLSSTSLTPQRPAVARQPQVEMSHQVCPAPKQVSDAELRVLQGCLRRWRQEVESDVRGESLPGVVAGVVVSGVMSRCHGVLLMSVFMSGVAV